MKILGIDIERLRHDSFRIKGRSVVIYTDPFRISSKEKADIILVSHEHYDHCDPDSVFSLLGADTAIFASSLAAAKLGKGTVMEPGQVKVTKGVAIRAVPAYNTNKFRSPGVPFHPRHSNMLGFVLDVDGVKIYFAGDTDAIPEMDGLGKIDIALLPISGVYVMTEKEAAEAVRVICPKIVVPMHYGTLSGVGGDVSVFKELVGKSAEVVVV